MQYFTFLRSNKDIVIDYTDKEIAVFPATSKGMDAFVTYANHFTAFGEQATKKDSKYNLYTFEADDPIKLPFPMNLNYTDARNADVLDKNDLKRAIQIMSQYDEGDIINMGDYLDIDANEWKESPMASRTNHSRDHLIYILSSIAKTLGQVVTTAAEYNDTAAVMEYQVLVTTPVKMIKVPLDKAIEILNVDAENPLLGGREDEDEEGEYGIGGDWWKNPQETIQRISEMIDEDLIY